MSWIGFGLILILLEHESSDIENQCWATYVLIEFTGPQKATKGQRELAAIHWRDNKDYRYLLRNDRTIFIQIFWGGVFAKRLTICQKCRPTASTGRSSGRGSNLQRQSDRWSPYDHPQVRRMHWLRSSHPNGAHHPIKDKHACVPAGDLLLNGTNYNSGSG